MVCLELKLIQPRAAWDRIVSGILQAGCSPGNDSAWPAAFSSEELPQLPPCGWRDGWMGMYTSCRGPSNTSIWPVRKRPDKAGISLSKKIGLHLWVTIPLGFSYFNLCKICNKKASMHQCINTSWLKVLQWKMAYYEIIVEIKGIIIKHKISAII